MAQIVTVKNGTTNEIQYPRTVKSALLNDDGTPLNPLTQTNIVNDLTTGGETNVLSAQQGVAINSAIGQLQDDIGNIDVSWDAITGKPTTFTPSTHTHLGLNGTNTVLEVQEYIDFHKNFSTSDYDARMHMDPTTGALEWYSALNSTHSMNITGEINSLKSSVVNGKQEVVNAINGSLGYASGLTTSNTHADYAWWIQNMVKSGIVGSSTNIASMAEPYSNNGPTITLVNTPTHEIATSIYGPKSVVVTIDPGLYVLLMYNDLTSGVVLNNDVKWVKTAVKSNYSGSSRWYLGLFYVKRRTNVTFNTGAFSAGEYKLYNLFV